MGNSKEGVAVAPGWTGTDWADIHRACGTVSQLVERRQRRLDEVVEVTTLPRIVAVSDELPKQPSHHQCRQLHHPLGELGSCHPRRLHFQPLHQVVEGLAVARLRVKVGLSRVLGRIQKGAGRLSRWPLARMRVPGVPISTRRIWVALARSPLLSSF